MELGRTTASLHALADDAAKPAEAPEEKPRAVFN